MGSGRVVGGGAAKVTPVARNRRIFIGSVPPGSVMNAAIIMLTGHESPSECGAIRTKRGILLASVGV